MAGKLKPNKKRKNNKIRNEEKRRFWESERYRDRSGGGRNEELDFRHQITGPAWSHQIFRGELLTNFLTKFSSSYFGFCTELYFIFFYTEFQCLESNCLVLCWIRHTFFFYGRELYSLRIYGASCSIALRKLLNVFVW